MLKLELVGRIGNGAWSSVFLMRDVNTSELFAVKEHVLPQEGNAQQLLACCAAIVREVEALMKLRTCPNVIRLHAVKRVDNTLFLIQDYFTRTLKDLIHEVKDRHWIRTVFCQIVKAVQQCHEHHVAHLDLKPTNVVVRKNTLETFVIDFGLCQFFNTTPMVFHNPIVTPGYRAPELLMHAHTFTEKVDIWSMGVILLEMYGHRVWHPECPDDDHKQLVFTCRLFGTPPDASGRLPDEAKGHHPKVLHSLFSDVPEGALRLASRLLHVDPQKRPNPQEILTDNWLK